MKPYGLQSGGASIPTVLNIFDRHKDAIDRGLVADGTTDNTPLLKAAIAAVVAAGGNSLFFPPGSYNFILPPADINASVPHFVLPAGFSLWGLPGSVTFKVSSASWAGVNTGRTAIMFAYNSNCFIGGIVFDGQKQLVNSGGFTPYGLCFFNRQVQNASNVLFSDLLFKNQLSNSLALECFCIQSGTQSTKLMFRNVGCKDSNGTGISINGDWANQQLPRDIDIVDCWADNMKWQGITVYGAYNIRIKNFTGKNCGAAVLFGGQGINLEWAYMIDIDNADCSNNQGCGIGGFGHIDVTIRNSRLYDNNQLDYVNLGEIGFISGSWFLNGAPDETGGAVPGGYYRRILNGCLQSLRISNCDVKPKTTGNVRAHLALGASAFVTSPAGAKTVPQSIQIDQGDLSDWSIVYTPNWLLGTSGSLVSWAPSTAVTVGLQRFAGGILWTCTTAGTTGTTGPVGAVGDANVADGSAVWTATSAISPTGYGYANGSPYALNAGIVWNEFRQNYGWMYKAVTPSAVFQTGITSTTGNGPVSKVYGTLETDGTVVWMALGPIQNSAYNTKTVDLSPPNVSSRGIIPGTGSCTRPLNEWTAAGLTVGDAPGGKSGNAKRLTTTAASSISANAVKLTEARRLLPGAYTVKARYRFANTPPNTYWHFQCRVQDYNSGTGGHQMGMQLGGSLEDQGVWYATEYSFVIPEGMSGQPGISYWGPNTGDSLDLELTITPIRHRNLRDEIWLGGRRIVQASAVPTSFDFEVGDEIRSPAGIAGDQRCTSAGSTGTVVATLSTTSGSVIATMSAADEGLRVGMYVTIAGVTGTKQIIYKSGLTVYLSSNASATVSAAAVSVVAPAFALASNALAAPTVVTGITAKAGGGQTDAFQLSDGDRKWHVVGTTATAADSVKLPPATSAKEVRVINAGSQALAVFPQEGQTIGNNTSATSVSIAAKASRIFTCGVNGTWTTT